jgi:ABC-type antimicrobial peptide transport system permease subunit
MYDVFSQRIGGPRGLTVMARVSEPAAAIEAALRDAVARVSTQLAVTGYKTQVEQIADSVAVERVFAKLLTVFGGFALLLVCLGLHGVTSYSVARRTNEIGIRMALGARPAQVLRLVLGQVAVLTMIGVAVGLPTAYFARSILASMLFGLTNTDPVTFAAAGLLMITVALAAGLMPARRAAGLDPLRAIRRDECP